MSIKVYSRDELTPDPGDDLRELRCDGGGYTGCSSYIEGGIGDRAPGLRATAKKQGWTHERKGALDFCPGCS